MVFTTPIVAFQHALEVIRLWTLNTQHIKCFGHHLIQVVIQTMAHNPPKIIMTYAFLCFLLKEKWMKKGLVHEPQMILKSGKGEQLSKPK